ncbi:hypothetical protein ADIS_4379 [Lunatimonas lonarensis]|uniref:Uncharacterized protein n=1 Tax=Lunatimonas lonarensis TaxID=1232681 RepID=R7ZM79_9BACT|nr:hypothetical protein ADIS_4379 [Lunatimonas lonarensis]
MKRTFCDPLQEGPKRFLSQYISLARDFAVSGFNPLMHHKGTGEK